MAGELRAEMKPNTRSILALAALAACSCGGSTSKDAVDASSVGSDVADADADVLPQDSCSGTTPTCDAGPRGGCDPS
jgi:hypothetical protein